IVTTTWQYIYAVHLQPPGVLNALLQRRTELSLTFRHRRQPFSALHYIAGRYVNEHATQIMLMQFMLNSRKLGVIGKLDFHGLKAIGCSGGKAFNKGQLRIQQRNVGAEFHGRGSAYKSIKVQGSWSAWPLLACRRISSAPSPAMGIALCSDFPSALAISRSFSRVFTCHFTASKSRPAMRGPVSCSGMESAKPPFSAAGICPASTPA